MSLILEALRKLEREKQPTDRPGFVVVPTARWGEDRSRAGLLFGIVFVCAVFSALGIGLWMGAARTARVREHVTAPAPVPPTSQRETDPLPGAATAPAPSPGFAGAPAAALPVPPYVELPGPAPSSPPTHVATAPATPLPATPDAAAPAEAAPETPVQAASAAPAEAPAPTDAPALVLTAIGAREGRPVAVIDDRLVHEGDEYDGWRVLAIGPDSVQVLVRGERRTLRFQ